MGQSTSAPDTQSPSGGALSAFAGTAGSSPPAGFTEFRRGASIGRYIVLDRIGQGAMGTVCAAYDPDLDRRVAIKLLRTASTSESARKRLVREARALAKLSHPNVVQVYDAGVHEGDVFVAMELVEGRSFKEWVQSEPAPDVRDVLRAYIDAARGLAAAHAQGLIHRDVKPANLLMGNDGRVRVVDFGLAAAQERRASDAPEPPTSEGPAEEEAESRPASEPPADAESRPASEPAADAESRPASTSGQPARPPIPQETPASAPSASGPPGVDGPATARPSGLEGRLDERLTAIGALMGTPAYMAPEQYASSDVGPAADQYSLCVSLYEALYGTLPFAADPADNGFFRIAAQLQSKRRGDVPPPPPHSKVPRYVHDALRRGLSPVPEDRYPSLAELIAALEEDPLARRRARRRSLAASAAAAVLAGAALSGWGRSDAPTDPCGDVRRELAGAWDQDVKDKVKAAFLSSGRPSAAETAEHVTAALDRYADAWQGMRADVCRASHTGAGALAQSLIDARSACLSRRLDELRALTTVFAAADATVLDKAAQAAETLYPIAYCADDKALTARVQPPEDPAVRARVEAIQARVDKLEALHRAGKYEEALTEAEPLLAEVTRLDFAPARAKVMYWIGRLRDDKGDFAGARAMLNDSLFLASRGGDDHLAAEAASELLVVIGVRQARVSEAQALMTWGPAIVERARDELLQARWDDACSGVMYTAGRCDEQAMAPLRRAIATREKVLGPDDPDLAGSIGDLGLMLDCAGRYSDALAAIERSIAAFEKALGPNHPEISGRIGNLSGTLRNMGRCEEAAAMDERGLRICEEVLGPGYGGPCPSLLDSLGLDLECLGRSAEAKAVLEKAVAEAEKHLGVESDYFSGTLTDLARTLISLGELDEADRHLKRALPDLEKAFGKTSIWLAWPLLSVGELALARHRPAEAVRVLSRALALPDLSARPAIQLALAQALWDIGRERRRAVALAREAEERAAAIGHARYLAKAKAWLAAHRR